MEAAIRAIAEQGLGASTAVIAKSAGVSNGALFTYFETKADLLNQLYIELKLRKAETTVANAPMDAEPREQLRYVWYRMLRWATEQPLERAALAQLAPRARLRALGDVIGHGLEVAAPFGAALAAALVADGRAREVAVTAVGHRRGEGVLRLVPA